MKKKKTITLAILIIMLSVVGTNVLYAKMDAPVTQLEPTPDWQCVCETAYCDCVYDCGTPFAACLIGSGLLGRLPWDAYEDCQNLLELCKWDCEENWGDDVEYTCYGLEEEPTPEEIINSCFNDCSRSGLTKMQCYEVCDMI